MTCNWTNWRIIVDFINIHFDIKICKHNFLFLNNNIYVIYYEISLKPHLIEANHNKGSKVWRYRKNLAYHKRRKCNHPFLHPKENLLANSNLALPFHQWLRHKCNGNWNKKIFYKIPNILGNVKINCFENYIKNLSKLVLSISFAVGPRNHCRLI